MITLAIAALNIKKSPHGTSTPAFIDSFPVVQRTQQDPPGLGDFNLTKLPSLIVGSQLDQHLHELMNPHVYFSHFQLTNNGTESEEEPSHKWIRTLQQGIVI